MIARGNDVRHDRKRHDRKDREVLVDDELETRILDVESAVEAYLAGATFQARSDLEAALHALDDETAASDAYRARRNSVVTLGAVAGLGTSSSNIVGQTGRFPIIDEVLLSVFQAQVALVLAAKAEITDSSPMTLDALASASQELAAAQGSTSHGEVGPPDFAP